MTFTIDSDNNITAHAKLPGSAEAAPSFNSHKELAKLTSQWPIGRFAETWNSFAGVAPFEDLKPVKKFMDRKSAVTRIWKAVQRLAADVASQPAPVTSRAKGAGKKASTSTGAPITRKLARGENAKTRKAATTGRDGSKKSEVLNLLRRSQGATLAEIMQLTAWQPHTVRGFVSGTLTKKLGLKVESFRTEEKERAYRVSV